MTDMNKTIRVLFFITNASSGSWFLSLLVDDDCLLKKKRKVIIKAALCKLRRTGAVSDPF